MQSAIRNKTKLHTIIFEANVDSIGYLIIATNIISHTWLGTSDIHERKYKILELPIGTVGMQTYFHMVKLTLENKNRNSRLRSWVIGMK